jgi:MerR family regulatory protein
MNDEIFSGELARICGVSPDTIRHYERVGVLPTAVRGANGAPPCRNVRALAGEKLDALARQRRQKDER